MSKISVVIPSRNEPYLEHTIKDIFAKASGDIEVIAVLDGYWPDPPLPDVPGLKILHRGKAMGMRAAINAAAAASKGEFIMKADAHCMFSTGFDAVLKADLDDSCVIVPRRYSLDPETWEVSSKSSEPVDYEYFLYPRKFDPYGLHGFHWDDRTKERMSISIDETLTFQGSCYLLHRGHFERSGFMTIDGYEGLPQQEAEEIGLTTWFGGGQVIVNKNCWYAHWHKPTSRGRGYFLGREQTRRCYRFSYQRWVHDHKKQFVRLIEKFWPLPGWPENWQEKIYQ